MMKIAKVNSYYGSLPDSPSQFQSKTEHVTLKAKHVNILATKKEGDSL